MARLPTKDDLSGPASLRSGRAIGAADTSAIGRGLQSFGASVSGAANDMVQQQNAVDLARAEAYKTEQFLAAENEFAFDPDYSTAPARAAERTGQIVGDAANLIRDQSMRTRWQIGAGTDAARVNDAVIDRGTALQREAETVAFDEALEANRRIFVDPNTPEAVRAKARADIQGAIEMGQSSGLLTPGDAATRTTQFLDEADYSLGLLSVEQGAFVAPPKAVQEVVSSVPGAVTVKLADGTVEERKGPRAWRNNNPGNIEYGDFAKSMGAIGTDGRFAIFPSYEAGRAAKAALIFDGANYRDLSIREAIYRYAPPTDGNNSANYAATVAEAAGLSQDTVMSSVPPAQRELILDAMERVEGYEAGTVNGVDAPPVGTTAPEWYDRLSPEQRQVINERNTTRQQQAATAAAAQAKVSYEAHKESLGLGILTGSVVSEQEILGDPMLNDGDKTTLLRSLRTEQEATGAARDYLAGIGAGTAAPLNPYSSDDQALADKSFDVLMGAVTPEQRGQATIQFVTESGMVPKPVVADVRMSLNSSDPAAVAAGLQQSAALYDAAPMAVGNVTNGQEIKDAAATYTQLVGEEGLSVEQAAQRVIDMRDPANIAKADVLKTIWDQAVKDDAFPVSDVTATFDTSILPGAPSAGLTPYQEEALQSDYLMAAERALKGAANGDVGIARQMALQEMKRTYGVSRVSGQEVVTKYPPENFYPALNGSQDYIRDLALSDAKSIAPDASNVMLVPTMETTQDVRAGQPPRYNLMYQRPDGVWDMAPSLFMVGPQDITDLSSLDAEERELRFEMERQYNEALRNRAGDNEITRMMEALPIGGIPTPTPADIVPGYADMEARLADIKARRRAALGQPEPVAPGASDAAAMEAERLWQEQNAATFGMMGGTQ